MAGAAWTAERGSGRSGAGARGVKLNIGGGKGDHARPEGWLVVDLRESADVKADIVNDGLPFGDGSVEVVFTSHTLEHVRPADLGRVLGEFRRVLVDGGVLRVLVPDIEKACGAYLAGDREFFERAEVTCFDPGAPVGGLLAMWLHSESAVGNGHVHCFTESSLRWHLERAGFVEVVRTGFRGSRVEELRGAGFDRHEVASLCVECVKGPSVLGGGADVGAG